MTDHFDLIEQLQAAAEITGDELLQAAASALSSQSLSLSEARAENDRKDAEIERLKKEVGQKHDEANRYVNEMIEWRSAFQRVTPGGSEFTSPQAVRDWADMLKMQVFEANKRAVLAERKALENGPAGLADAHTKSPDSDLSSLRKGAEVVGEAAAYDFVAGWHERQAKLFREMADDDPRTAKPARDRAKEAAIHHAASAAALRNRAADDRRRALTQETADVGE